MKVHCKEQKYNLILFNCDKLRKSFKNKQLLESNHDQNVKCSASQMPINIPKRKGDSYE